ncbi:branched-chain amino acid ABC transporter permease [Variovorax sp. GB1P17]|uniref:branched-chain amino acid ABC transporter permease n=1 Tax=Variovorax sp. GB1P17 TaxID=3443740 RepID=UPI003F45F2F3
MADKDNARRWALGIALLVGWAVLPALASRSVVDMFVFAAIYSIAGLGVAFLLGQCGILSLAQSVFYGIGGYGTAYCCTVLGWPAGAAMAVAMLVSATLAGLLGAPVLRLSGYFLALATLALALIGQTLFVEWDWLTGGTLGTGGIPKLSLFGWQLATPQRFYYFIWAVLALVFAAHYALLRSRYGYAMRAMRDAPDAALALGLPVHRLKIQAFMLSAVLGSLAGSMLAHYVSFVSVDSFNVAKGIHFLLIAVLGGAQTIAGTIAGALFITLLPDLLGRFGDIHALLFALLLLATVFFLPQGFGGVVLNLTRRRKAKPAASAKVAP